MRPRFHTRASFFSINYLCSALSLFLRSAGARANKLEVLAAFYFSSWGILTLFLSSSYPTETSSNLRPTNDGRNDLATIYLGYTYDIPMIYLHYPNTIRTPFFFLFRQFHAVEEQAPDETVGISFGSARGDKESGVVEGLLVEDIIIDGGAFGTG